MEDFMRHFTLLFALVFTSVNTFGQTFPKAKGQAQGTYQTIERVQVPNSGVTVTGDKAVLMEWDKYNMLVNPSFEHQTFSTGWTVNAGTASVNTTNFSDGVKSMSISLSGVTGDILTQCVTPAQKTTNIPMAAIMRVNSSLTNLQVCSVIGSAEQQCVPTSAAANWAQTIATMNGIDSSQYCVKLKSTSSATGTVLVDEGYVGRNLNISTSSVPYFVGSIRWNGTAGCSWSFTGSTVSNFPAQASCPTPSTTGSVTAPGTKIPAAVLPNAGAGTYVIYGRGFAYGTSGTEVRLRFSDGTNNTATSTFYGSGGTLVSGGGWNGEVTLTSAVANWTIQAQGGNVGGTSVVIDNTSTVSSQNFEIAIYKYPSSEQVSRVNLPVLPTVTRFLSGSGNYTAPAGVTHIKVRMVGGGGGGGGSGTAGSGAGTAGGNTTFGSSLLTANGGNFGTRGSQAPNGAGGTATVNAPAVTIVAATGSNGGEACNMNTANLFVQGGYGGPSAFGGSGGAAYAEGGQNGATNTGSGGAGGGSSSGAGTVCGGGGGAGGYLEAFIANPSGAYAYSVGAAGSGGAAGTGGFIGGAGGSGIIIIEEYYQGMYTPLVFQSVITSSNGINRIERAVSNTNCTSSPCSLTTSTPGITVTRTGTGAYVANFSPAFAAIPSCSGWSISQGNFVTVPYYDGGGTASTFPFHTIRPSTEGNFDSTFTITCVGPN